VEVVLAYLTMALNDRWGSERERLSVGNDERSETDDEDSTNMRRGLTNFNLHTEYSVWFFAEILESRDNSRIASQMSRARGATIPQPQL
jgi:hypothetical protein